MSTVTEPDYKLRIERHPERKADHEAESVLRQGLVAHVGFVDAGLPYVIPMSYEYADDAIYLHGSLHSRALKLLATGAPACIEITLLEGLVYSRAAMFHSMNYRSAIVFGTGSEVTDPEIKQRVFDQMIARYFEGRRAGQDYEAAPDKHLAQTLVVKVPIAAISAKQRQGGPKGPRDASPDAPGSAGVAQVTPMSGCPFHAKADGRTDRETQNGGRGLE